MSRLQRVVANQIEGQDSPSQLRTLVDFLGAFNETMDFAEDSCLYLLDRKLLAQLITLLKKGDMNMMESRNDLMHLEGNQRL